MTQKTSGNASAHRSRAESSNIAGRVLRFAYRWVSPLFDVRRLRVLPEYFLFLRDWITYSGMEGAEPFRLLDSYPCLAGKSGSSAFDADYFYQDIWAFRRILESKARLHVDVASRVDFVGMLSSITHVIFLDLRRVDVALEGLEPVQASILNLPFSTGSIKSLSCLNVAEHIGLGRYGDPLDPAGTRKAAAELARVLATGGDLYFSLPIGRARVCFNAHRVHSPGEIPGYFHGLDLMEFSVIDGGRRYKRKADPLAYEGADWACGLFWFKKL